MAGMNHDEQVEAFKLFMQHYNASQRTKEKKPKNGRSSVTMKQHAGRIENKVKTEEATFHAQNATYNFGGKPRKIIEFPISGSIGANKGLLQEIEIKMHEIAQERKNSGKDYGKAIQILHSEIKRRFGIKGIKALKWIASQKEAMAPEIFEFLQERYDHTKKGKIEKSQKVKLKMTKKEARICIANLIIDNGLSDTEYRDLLERLTGKRSTKSMTAAETLRAYRLLEDAIEKEVHG